MVRFRPIGRTLNWTYGSVLNVVRFQFYGVPTLNRTVYIQKKKKKLLEIYHLSPLRIHIVLLVVLDHSTSYYTL
jgi:hypothetical protein